MEEAPVTIGRILSPWHLRRSRVLPLTEFPSASSASRRCSSVIAVSTDSMMSQQRRSTGRSCWYASAESTPEKLLNRFGA